MELLRSLATFVEPPGAETARLAELLELPESPADWQYAEVFLQQLVPYASVYLGEEGQIGGEARDRIAGFWRALGETPPVEPDHLAVLLSLQAQLAEHAGAAEPGSRERAAWQQARAALLWEHLLSWLPHYLDKLRTVAPPAYRAWADLLLEALAAEAAEVRLPAALPAHLRDAAALPAPAQGAEEFLQAVLAPVRAGFLVTRMDLADIAARLGLGLRAGERAYTLRALMAQDAAAVLAALGELAAATARRDGELPPVIDAFWRQRAAASAALLDEAAGRARHDETAR